MKGATRWPVLCTRCGSTAHYSEDCTRIPAFGLSDIERDMIDASRRGRNCALAIIVVLIGGYLALIWIGGAA